MGDVVVILWRSNFGKRSIRSSAVDIQDCEVF